MIRGKLRFRSRIVVVGIILFLTILALGLLASVASAVPIINATKGDTLVVDNDGDHAVDPGDTIRYTIYVANSGWTNASGVLFNDTIDANTTLVGGSLKTTPIARHDQYASLGNVGITVPAPGVLVNDEDPDGGSVSVIPAAGGTASGGAFSIGSDGAFSYLPPTGFEGTDQFNYTIQDTDGNIDPATVFIAVTEMIWFIDNAAPSPGSGGLSTPFDSISAFNAVQTGTAPGAKDGDIVFLHSGSGNYTNGVILRNGQILIGQGATDTIANIAGITVPPFSNALPATGGSKPTITNSGGDGISLSANNTVRGLTAGNASGSSFAGVSVGALNISEVIVNNTTGGGLELNSGALSVVLESLTTVSSSDEGIDVSNVSGSLTIPAGSINNTNSRAINIDGNPSLALNVTLTSVSSSGAANGILVRDTTGFFTVAGSGSTDGSGGTISNITNRGASFINAANISLSNMNFTNATTANGVAPGTATCNTAEPAGNNNTGCNAPIYLENVSGVTLTNLTINGSAQNGINGYNVTNFSLANSELSNIGDQDLENGIQFLNLLGNNTFNNVTIDGSRTRNALIENVQGSSTITLTNSTINNAVGEDGFFVKGASRSGNNATITFNVSGSSFTHNHSVQLKAHAEEGSNVTTTIQDNTFDGEPLVVGNVGIDLAVRDRATLNFDVLGTRSGSTSSQTFLPIRGQVVNVFASGGGAANGTISGNDIQSSELAAGVRVVAEVTDVDGAATGVTLNPSIIVNVSDNEISGIKGSGLAGIHIEARDGNNSVNGVGRVDATIDGNNVTSVAVADAAMQIYVSDITGNHANTVCANITNNYANGVGGFFGDTDFYYGNPPGGGADFGVAQMQGFTVDVPTTWANQGNTDGGHFVLSEGAVVGGTCTAVTAPAPVSPVAASPVESAENIVNTGPFSPRQESAMGGDRLAGVAFLEAFRWRHFWEPARTAAVLDNELVQHKPSAISAKPLQSGETLNVDLGTMNPGQVVVIFFDVTVDSGIPSSASQVCNQGLFTGANFADLLTDDPDVGGATDPTPTCTPVDVANVDLQVRKSDQSFVAEPGDTINYTIHYTNTGSIEATGVVLTDTVPAGTTFNAAASAIGWSCADGAPAGTICTFDIGRVGPNYAGGSLPFAADVLDPLPSSFSFIVNGAAIGDDGAGGPDQNPGDNFSIAITPVDARSDLRIRKVDNDFEALPGDTINYTIRFTNTGTNTANGVVLTDTVPQGTTFNASASTSLWNCASEEAGSLCTLPVGTMPGNYTSGSVVFAVDVLDPLPSSFNFIVNGAAIGDDGAGGPDQNPGDNFSIAITPVDARSDLRIRKVDHDFEAEPGDTIGYTIRFTNTGTNTANGVVLTDTVPQGTTFNASLSTSLWECADTAAGSLCTLPVGTMPGNYTSGSVVFAVDVLDPLPSSFSFIVNGAAIGDDGAGGPDQNPGDNFSIAITPVDARSDLRIRKVDNDFEAEPGDTINYTIRFTNTGTNTANGVVLTDTVPQGTTFNAGASTSLWDCTGMTAGSLCTLPVGTMPGNYTSGSVVFAVDVDSPAEANRQFIVNGAAIGDDGAGGPDQNPGDNFSIAITPLNAAPDLQISKDDGVEFVGPGGTIQYTIVYTNVGNRNTDSTIISETVPANTTFDFGSNPDGFVCNNPVTGEEGASCIVNVGTVPGNGGGGSVTFAVIVDNPLTPGVTETTNVVDIFGIAVTADANPDDNSAEHTTTLNVPPEITGVSPPTQTVQYSDLIATVTFTATDPGPDDLTLAASAALPDALALSAPSCGPATGGGKECTWTLSGQMLEAAGTYTVEVTASDGVLFSDPALITITVEHEDARVAFDGANPVSVSVASDGGDSEPFTLAVDVTEFDDPDDVSGDSNLAGNISLAQVTMTLVPVGPGGSESPTSCSASTSPGLSDPDSPHDYDILTVSCDFDAVPVNTYIVQVSVGGDFYSGSNEDVLTVYDPSLGFTSGGGWFYWPGTTDRTNFGYTMKYNKKATKAQGSLLVIRHLPDGSIYRLKSNAIDGLALGDETDYGWATFSGKATYLGAGMLEAEGNHTFIVYVEDWDEPGAGADRFWIEVQDKDGDVIGDLSIDPPAATNAETLEGGNIIVPHKPKGKGRSSLAEQAASADGEPLVGSDEMVIFMAGETYESLVVDDDGRRTGLVDGAPLAEIPESAYLAGPYDDSTRMELFWLLASGDYDVEIRGSDNGQVAVQLLVPKNSQFATIFVYEGLVTTPYSVARLQMSDGPAGPVLENDLDRDGQVDQVLEAIDEIRVRLSSHGVFLPTLSSGR